MIHRIKWLMIVRLIIVTVIVGLGMAFLRYPETWAYLKPFAVLVALTYFFSALFLLAFRAGVPVTAVLYVQIIFDVFIVSGTVHLTEGIESQFSLLYFLVILSASIFLYLRGSLIIATLTAIVYSLLIVLEYTDYIPTFHPTDLPGKVSVTREFLLLKVYLHLCFFYLLAFVSGFLSERERKKEHELEEKTEELTRIRFDTDEILRNMSGGVISIDHFGRIVTFNKAAESILGYKEKNIRGKSCAEVFRDDIPDFCNFIMTSMKDAVISDRHEIDLKRADESTLPLRISTSILGDPENKRGLIAVFEDLTEERDLREQIRRSERLAAVGELAANIAHEIRNPLASISGSVQMLLNESELDPSNSRLMHLIVKESNRLSQITTDFLTYARLRPGAQEVITLQEVITDVAELLRNHPRRGERMEIRTEVPPQPLYVRVDEHQLKQTLINLGLNGMDAMDKVENATLTFQLQAVYTAKTGASVSPASIPNGFALINVTDTGQGIKKEHLKNLFTPFFTTKRGGTGLGLAIVNRIIDNHNGWIDVRSEIGKGTTFRIHLPLVLSSELQQNSRAIQPEISSQAKRHSP